MAVLSIRLSISWPRRRSREDDAVRNAMGQFCLLAGSGRCRADHGDDLADMLGGDVAAVWRQLELRRRLLMFAWLSLIRFLVSHVKSMFVVA